MLRESIIMLRSAVKHILRESVNKPTLRNWTLEGFGMLRLNLLDDHYLDDDVRLNVWHPKFIHTPKPSMIRTHPWDFESIVVSGVLEHQRYEKFIGPAPDGTEFAMLALKPGKQCDVLREPSKLVYLAPHKREMYFVGDSYRQRWYEIHESFPSPGAVTVNYHQRGDRPDVAYAFYRVREQWQTAEPKDATPEVVREICSFALRMWK